MRAVLDVNVLVSAVLSPEGAPARILVAWRDGQFDLVASPALLSELRRVLAYPKIRRTIDAADAEAYVRLIAESELVADPDIAPPVRSSDPNDDYLIALAASQNAILVTGDRDLLATTGGQPIRDTTSFLALLADPKVRAVRDALSDAYPAGDIDQIKTDIERGYLDEPAR